MPPAGVYAELADDFAEAMERRLVPKFDTIATLETKMGALESELSELKLTLRERDQRIGELEEQLRERDQTIADLKSTGRPEEVESLRKENEQLKSKLAELREVVMRDDTQATATPPQREHDSPSAHTIPEQPRQQSRLTSPPPMALPPDSIFAALLHDGRTKRLGELPEKTQTSYKVELCSYEKCRNTTYKSRDWWAKLQKRPLSRKAALLCLSIWMAGTGHCTWTVERRGEFACITCTNKQRPCLLRDDHNNTITMLPLVEEARLGAGPDDEGYWICAVKDFSKHKDYRQHRGLWEGADKVGSKRVRSEEDDGNVDSKRVRIGAQ